MELYLLDWQETKHAKQPKPAEVAIWLERHGITTAGTPKVYANGTVQFEADKDPTALWPEFEPVVIAVEDMLGVHVKELLSAKAEVLRIPEARRNATERLLLAVTALLLYGYGITE